MQLGGEVAKLQGGPDDVPEAAQHKNRHGTTHAELVINLRQSYLVTYVQLCCHHRFRTAIRSFRQDFGWKRDRNMNRFWLVFEEFVNVK